MQGVDSSCYSQPKPTKRSPDGEGAYLGLDAGLEGLLCDTRSALHVLVAAVGAGPDEACLQLCRPLVLLQRLAKLQAREGSSIAVF